MKLKAVLPRLARFALVVLVAVVVVVFVHRSMRGWLLYDGGNFQIFFKKRKTTNDFSNSNLTTFGVAVGDAVFAVEVEVKDR